MVLLIALTFSRLTEAFTTSTTTSEQVQQGQLLTFDALIQNISQYKFLPQSYVLLELLKDQTRLKPTITIDEQIEELKSSTYRVFIDTLDVTKDFKPQVKFYCQVDESSDTHAIKKIVNVELNRHQNNHPKAFHGQMFINVENPNRIYYSINGEFYEGGSTSYESGLNIGTHQPTRIQFESSTSVNSYQYYFAERAINY